MENGLQRIISGIKQVGGGFVEDKLTLGIMDKALDELILLSSKEGLDPSTEVTMFCDISVIHMLSSVISKYATVTDSNQDLYKDSFGSLICELTVQRKGLTINLVSKPNLGGDILFVMGTGAIYTLPTVLITILKNSL